MKPRTVLLLQSTCCYFDDTVKLNDLLARELVARGAIPIHILTDGTPCTYFMELDEPREAECARRHARARHALATTNQVPVMLLADYVARTKDNALSDWSTLVASTPLGAIEYREIQLWETVKGSVAAYAQWLELPDDPERLTGSERTLVIQFMKAAVGYTLALEALFDEMGPSHLLVFNGLYYLERIASDLANRRGIRVVVTESSCFRDRKYYVNVSDGDGGRQGFASEVKHRMETGALSEDEKDLLARYMLNVYDGSNNWIVQRPPGRDVRSYLRIPPQRRIATFFGQVPHDSVITYGRPSYLPMYKAARQTMDLLAARRDWHLIVRLHPGGVNSAMREDLLASRLGQENLPRNVSLVIGRQLNTYDVMRASDLGITVCSQAGLEILSMHKPIVVLGDPIYAGLGVTFDVCQEDMYEAVLDYALANSVPDGKWCDRVDQMLYHLIFRYLVPVNRVAGAFDKDGLERVVAMF